MVQALHLNVPHHALGPEEEERRWRGGHWNELLALFNHGAIAQCATHLGPSQAATTSTESFSQVSPRSKQITLGRQVRNWLGSPSLSTWIGGRPAFKTAAPICMDGQTCMHACPGLAYQLRALAHLGLPAQTTRNDSLGQGPQNLHDVHAAILYTMPCGAESDYQNMLHTVSGIHTGRTAVSPHHVVDAMGSRFLVQVSRHCHDEIPACQTKQCTGGDLREPSEGQGFCRDFVRLGC